MDAADNAADVLSGLAERVAEMHALMGTPRPEYEYTGPRTVGGVPATAPYAIQVPFAGPCEVCILSVVAAGTQNTSGILSTEVASIGASLNADGSVKQSLDGSQPWFFLLTGYTQAAYATNGWLPLNGSSSLYLFVNGSTGGTAGGLYVVLQFRRRINPAGVPSQGYP